MNTILVTLPSLDAHRGAVHRHVLPAVRVAVLYCLSIFDAHKLPARAPSLSAFATFVSTPRAFIAKRFLPWRPPQSIAAKARAETPAIRRWPKAA